MYRFEKNYFLLAVMLLIVEVLIALFAHDRIIRPYVGDYLVVMLLYCMVKSFINSPVQLTAWSVLLVSYIIEILQYFNIVKRIGLEHSEIANVIIGNSFQWIDILAYTLGILTVMGIENKKRTLNVKRA